jgi:hypothetical protein
VVGVGWRARRCKGKGCRGWEEGGKRDRGKMEMWVGVKCEMVKLAYTLTVFMMVVMLGCICSCSV